MKRIYVTVILATLFCNSSFAQMVSEFPTMDRNISKNIVGSLGGQNRSESAFSQDPGRFILDEQQFRERFRDGENGFRQDRENANALLSWSGEQDSLVSEIFVNHRYFLIELDVALRNNTRLARKLGISLDELGYSYIAQIGDIARLPGNENLLSVLNLARHENCYGSSGQVF